MIKRHTKVRPLSYGVYFWTVCFLGLTGLIVSIYLAVSHFRVYTDITYASFCAVSAAINCDTVSQSSYSIFLNVPVPVWGVMGYVFFLVMCIPLRPGKKIKAAQGWSILLLLSLIYSTSSLILAGISTYSIRKFCPMCIATYGINFGLLFYTWLIRRRFANQPFFRAIQHDSLSFAKNQRQIFLFVAPFLILFSLLPFFFPTYWQLEPPPLSEKIPKGFTDEGYPYIGGRNPLIEIVEFSDYECFQCNKVHFFLRQIVNEYPDRIRLVHRHFPMDHKFNPVVQKSFHVRAGGLALLAMLAADKNLFWEMNDLLFDISRNKEGIDLKMVAARVGIAYDELMNVLENKSYFLKLSGEIRKAISLGVTGTPSFQINGVVYSGQIPGRILKEFLK